MQFPTNRDMERESLVGGAIRDEGISKGWWWWCFVIFGFVVTGKIVQQIVQTPFSSCTCIVLSSHVRCGCGFSMAREWVRWRKKDETLQQFHHSVPIYTNLGGMKAKQFPTLVMNGRRFYQVCRQAALLSLFSRILGQGERKCYPKW